MSLYVPYYRPYNKHNTNIHAAGGIRTHNPSKLAAAHPRPRPRSHWDWHGETIMMFKISVLGGTEGPTFAAERQTSVAASDQPNVDSDV
jgi:hypothetical protein